MMTGNETTNTERQTKPVNDDFVRQYIDTRKKEQRLFADEHVRHLPNVPASHLLFKEWQVRKLSAKKLGDYLRKKKTRLKILEVGCGNGWLAAAMARIPATEV